MPYPYTGSPASFTVVMAAWVIVGVYFIAAAFGTQKIASKEAAGKRTGDNLVLIGGYALLFVQIPQWGGFNQAFVPVRAASLAGWVGALIGAGGLMFTLWARIALGRYWSRIVAVKTDHKLVTTGPYRWVRHPLYTGLLFGTLGTALVFGLWHGLIGAALLWAGFISRAHREDGLMAQQFGAEFAAYRARTGRLLPGLGRGDRADAAAR